MEIGLIGLGVMGRNLALNIAAKGYKLHVFNRTSSKTDSLIQERPDICPHYSVEDLVKGMKSSPKIILLMLTSGKVVDIFLEELGKHLSKDDIVIDGGNSSFKDTIRRNSYGFEFVGCGISGGEKGARNGASIMVGCGRETWEKVRGFLTDISATNSSTGENCCVWLGEDGAGHFVKMIHNGIEYGDMAIISETYLILRSLGLDNREISSLFDNWDKKESESYLLRISCSILRMRNEKGSVIDQIMDVSEQKGTGKETVVTSMEMGVAVPAIMEAVASRIVSHMKDKRCKLSSKLESIKGEKRISSDAVRKGFYLARIVSYIQGLNLLMEGKEKYGWKYTIRDISRVWSDGCILRGKLINAIEEMGRGQEGDFELSPGFVSLCNKNFPYLKEMVLYSVENEVAVPTIASCLMYLSGIKEKEGGGSMIQAMRDYFGSHMVTMEGEAKAEHIEWA
ncbi:6-phosphogluconate dehydrogenase [Encephalitozoon intestinalis ATCC 50506]|uniref:6-phosphogluconate dehydrogenase, decarboxylating n=1 Tax=Encephalitozoon intestinalis (strain ATCC 50506) TaxID=876142 RepID=E0S7A8_ENCIT|nr:6-phosphogluconate dehydrogenase [Encephalitozoon intestinalis ATCC 50506]ADM11536.1 6-phosphogluconate dehydrogenase [Encephalitozoon intestinalis ATCC 50506]UTX45250.1 6-phosphogluconate dehydrogenase [Encephalitozoon intestinalis]